MLKLTGYEEQIRDLDTEIQRVFFRVQELGGKLITLALILLSVTILSSKRYLLLAGVALGAIGLLVALDGYFLLF